MRSVKNILSKQQYVTWKCFSSSQLANPNQRLTKSATRFTDPSCGADTWLGYDCSGFGRKLPWYSYLAWFFITRTRTRHKKRYSRQRWCVHVWLRIEPFTKHFKSVLGYQNIHPHMLKSRAVRRLRDIATGSSAPRSIQNDAACMSRRARIHKQNYDFLFQIATSDSFDFFRMCWATNSLYHVKGAVCLLTDTGCMVQYPVDHTYTS